ncbi:hypothetical protein C5167_018331 [Papaver somniferum]|uniref:Uncharacterized protein n=1 Tax=Papaver somniferum TaxID=3469 RepID=A0A4Y7ILY8_PAPSO|nr:hypothetical protein C5167_018331 [Papaver somniferum]
MEDAGARGEELHVISPKNLLWKFDKLIREGRLYLTDKLSFTTTKPEFRPSNNERGGFFQWNTAAATLHAYSMSIPLQKFSFITYEGLNLKTYLTGKTF